ncbi:TrmH family RNA methyltransferase [Thiohalorhabdus sp.]|uniref:TrmH family RNA methyltransferase n=1 Tax=Thiohalorhabdus sp. TaxID=3094134 RepID=UPI002FC2FE0D
MTLRRYRQIREVLDRRQPDLTVLMDRVSKPFNLSAIPRTCDAVGVFEAQTVAPEGPVRADLTASGGSSKWVPLHVYGSLEEGLNAVRARGMQLVAADNAAGARDFREIDDTLPTAMILGPELYGPRPDAPGEMDHHVAIPMGGMVESLNVSAANAVLLFEAQCQRQAAGFYDEPRLDADTYWRTLFRWAYPHLARYCDSRGLPYPRLCESDGSLLDPLPEGWTEADGQPG